MASSHPAEDDFAAIEEAVARMEPAVLAAWARAVRGAAREVVPEPSIIPAPELLDGGRVRFPCPLGCGWGHVEDPGTELFGPLLLPADFTGADLSAAITAQADERAEERRRRVEEAIRDHFTESHPGR